MYTSLYLVGVKKTIKYILIKILRLLNGSLFCLVIFWRKINELYALIGKEDIIVSITNELLLEAICLNKKRPTLYSQSSIGEHALRLVKQFIKGFVAG